MLEEGGPWEVPIELIPYAYCIPSIPYTGSDCLAFLKGEGNMVGSGGG